MNTSTHSTRSIPLTTTGVSADTLGHSLAVETLVQLGKNRDNPLTQPQVAVFLILAEQHGWNHLQPAYVHDLEFDGRATETTWQETLLEWLTSHPQDRAKGTGTRNWPNTLEAFLALDNEDPPPARDQEWLMALAALAGAPSGNQKGGIPLSLYNCFLNGHLSILDLVLKLPGSPSMASIFQTLKTDPGNLKNAPTWGKWVLDYREGQLPHLTQTYPDVRLTPEQIAACKPEDLPLVIGWLPTDKEFRDSMLSRLEKHLNADGASPLGSNEWIRVRRTFLEFPPAAKEEQALLRQAVVNEAMRFSYGELGHNWTADLSLGSIEELLLGQETTHSRINGPVPVLAALLLSDLFGRHLDHQWERYVGTNPDTFSTQDGMAGILAPALNQSFGKELPLRGLIAISLMGAARFNHELTETMGGSDTTAAFLLGIGNTEDFIRNSLEDAMTVTRGLIKHLDPGDHGSYFHIVRTLALRWAKAMKEERISFGRSLLEGQMNCQLYWLQTMSEWTGFWYLPAPSGKAPSFRWGMEARVAFDGGFSVESGHELERGKHGSPAGR